MLGISYLFAMVGGVLRAKLTMFDDIITVVIRLTAMHGETMVHIIGWLY